MEDQEKKPKVPKALSLHMSRIGRKGGKGGSHEDKSRAGKISWEKRLARAAEKPRPWE